MRVKIYIILCFVFLSGVAISNANEFDPEDALILDSGLVGFSLKGVLNDLGYTPFSFSGVPINNTDDLEASMLGVPNDMVQLGGWEWPFSNFASSPDLSFVAMSLDRRGFRGQSVVGKIIILNVPDSLSESVELQLEYDFANLYEKPEVISLNFITTSLLQVGVAFGPSGYEPLENSDQTYYLDYWFVSTDGVVKYNLLEELRDIDAVNVKAYGKNIYIVETRAESQSESSYLVISYNPSTRVKNVLLAVESVEIGRSLFHGPVDEPGRDVWAFGENSLHVRFSLPNRSGAGGFEYLALNVEGEEAQISEAVYPYPEAKLMIEGTSEYLLNPQSAGLSVINQEGQTISYHLDADYPLLSAFTGGFVVIEAHLDTYRHYILDLDGGYDLVLSDRLIKAEYFDGGFIGLSNVTMKTEGDVKLYRYIYNPTNLAQSAVRRDEYFSGQMQLQNLMSSGLTCKSILGGD